MWGLLVLGAIGVIWIISSPDGEKKEDRKPPSGRPPVDKDMPERKIQGEPK